MSAYQERLAPKSPKYFFCKIILHFSLEESKTPSARGGRPLLGYDVDRSHPGAIRLVVNEDEAERVRRIFELYLEHGSLMPVVKILNERGWRTKRWVTKKGVEMGGRPFQKGSLFKLLTNLPYLGKVWAALRSAIRRQ